MSSPGHGQKSITLFENVTADETQSQQFDVRGYEFIKLYVKATGTVSSGVLVLEDFPSGNLYGTGAPVAGTPLDFSSVSLTNGVYYTVMFYEAAYGYVKAHITTAIGGGGSISAYLECH